jgi:hypothetical protein
MSEQIDIAVSQRGFKMANKVAELSPIALEVLEVIKASDRPLTLAEIKESVPLAQPAHLNALRSPDRNLVVAEEVEVIVQSKRKVLAYSLKTE